MIETAALVTFIIEIMFFVFLSVNLLYSYIKEKDAISFVLTATYFVTVLFLAYGVITEIYGR